MIQPRIACLLLVGALSTQLWAQKKPLDLPALDAWRSVVGTTLSRDGKWALYRLVPQDGDATLEIKSTDGAKTFTVPRASTAAFSNDGQFVIATVVPPQADVKKARRDKVKPEDQPKNDLTLFSLASGGSMTLQRVTSFTLPEEDSGWFVYKPEPPKPEPAKPAEAKTAESKPAEVKPEAKSAEKKEEKKEEKDKKPTKKAEHKVGETIVVRNFQTGNEERIENVASYRFSKDGKVLVYVLSTKDGAGDGIVWYDLAAGKKTPVVTAMGRYPRLDIDESGKYLAFLTDKDDYAAKKPSHSLYLSKDGGEPKLVAKEGTDGVPKGYWVPDNSQVRFSKKATRLLFSVAPKPAEEPKDETPDDEKVSVDVWNWQDKVLQPQQLLQAASERTRTYDAAYSLDAKKIAVLETSDLRSVSIAKNGDGDTALGSDDQAYDLASSWDPGYNDYYLVNPNTGERKPLVKGFTGGLDLSPEGKYVYGYDPKSREFWVIDAKSGDKRVVNAGLPPIWDEENDVPSLAGGLGAAGWTKDDARLLIYDRYDIWSVDPTGKEKPINVTNGVGRNLKIRFRYVPQDREADAIDPQESMLLSAFDERTKDAGFYRDSVSGSGYPQKVLMAPKTFSVPVKAKKADVFAYTQQDFVEYADLWVADTPNLKNPRKLSNANPQQASYSWGTSELVEWTSNDGVPLQGILYKPDNFDYGKKYPMITYFYEKNSDTLNAYRTPAPTASILNISIAVSNGYVVFVPDIVYKEGYPGESAMSCIMPGVQSILARGYIDPKKLAIDGQSWGGYQVAYLITETNMFTCAYAGAAVSDMFSAYGGIRWGSGLVRQFQYEHQQSRIGGTIWDKPLRFLENSPQFFLDKVQTPVLMMNNDKDGAVPWYQGIEMFTGLRRLGKPAWMLVYNDEDHNLVQRKNRKDLTIRKQQFFDYYLKGAPMPVWMKSGVPATEKGKNMGLELTKN